MPSFDVRPPPKDVSISHDERLEMRGVNPGPGIAFLRDNPVAADSSLPQVPTLAIVHVRADARGAGP
jgi:hypothetical protein